MSTIVIKRKTSVREPQQAGGWREFDKLRMTRLVSDSREVRRGDTFVAYRGESQDGRDYIAQAIERGAGSVLWEREGFRWNTAWQVPNLGVRKLRQCCGEIASRVHGQPSARLWMIGITGTNGKTTCSQWIARALARSGRRCAVIGTLGHGMCGRRGMRLRPLANTTPEAAWLHERLARFERQGADTVSMEVSSIGLDQHRVAGVQFDVALFTNLTRDHLEYHGNMRRYGEAKARLFEMPSLSHAVVNLDDTFGVELERRLRGRKLRVVGYGFGRTAARGATGVRGQDLVIDGAGIRFTAVTPWGSAAVRSPLIGRFNASNLLATLAVLLASGVALRKAVAEVQRLKSVPGRMQAMGGGARPLAVVDYAHTPDALAQVLDTLRPIACPPARLICVLGCGGDRDRGKRPLMGRIASERADRVIVTSDNPRGENPRRIIADIVVGMKSRAEVVADRACAIRRAICFARRGDVVLIAGKGHETYQETKGVRRPFDDRAIARKEIAAWRAR